MEEEENKVIKLKKKVKEVKMIAKKDWLIVQNKERYDIKKGDDLSSLPSKFFDALKSENVI